MEVHLIMELTKEEMELVISWLEDHYYYPDKDHVYTDMKKLPGVVAKFQTYLKGGETKNESPC